MPLGSSRDPDEARGDQQKVPFFMPPLAAYLAAESWSPGAVGFWLLLALPGLALLAHAKQMLQPPRLAPVAPLAVALLGLDVTDSARTGVVTAGYVFAVLGAVAALAAAVALHRRTPTAA